MLKKFLGIVGVVVASGSIICASMNIGARLYQKYSTPARTFMASDSEAQNGDLNGDGRFPDLIINDNMCFKPMYKSHVFGDDYFVDSKTVKFFAPDVDYSQIKEQINKKFGGNCL